MDRTLRRFPVLPVLVVAAHLLVAVIFHVPGTLFSAPYGIHFIRQTDSIAFVEHFTHFAANLFTPGVLDLRNAPADGRCAGEFPLFYWLVGMVQRIAGEQHWLLRAINLTLVMAGQVLLTLNLARVFKGRWVAMGMALLLFGSGILAHYAATPLPDAGVYGLVMIGWALMLPGLFGNAPVVPPATVAAFVLAGLIKAPAAMHLFALLALALAGTSRGRAVAGKWTWAAMGAGLAAIAAWHLYAINYNATNGSRYFMTWVEPVWASDPQELARAAGLAWDYWWSKYLHPTTWHVLALLCALMIARWRRTPRPVQALCLLLLGAGAGYLALFFRKLADHDYYFLTLLPVIALLLITGMWHVTELVRSRNIRALVTIAIWALAVSALRLAHTEVGRRAAPKPDPYARTGALTHGLAEWAQGDPLPLDARVVVLGDSTTNGALIALGRLGWTYPGYPRPAGPDMGALVREGASHVLSLGGHDPQWPDLTLEKEDVHWRLWRITPP
ncbi:MAG: hypothetical protein RBT71_10610 [Flavobacteriales bacterium]|jgi:hypothetical protein|nr:hypothetical protein [Flavobacteriales bacterium]